MEVTQTDPMVIASAAFPNVYLRMDGSGMTQPLGPGGGTVNCQFGAGPWEQFNVESQADGTVAIASVAFPGVYLRMDGSGMTQALGPGGGTVNCQFGAGPWEKFRLEPQADGTVAIASVAFPGVYLRMDGNGMTQALGPGGGTVNCQFTAGPWEKFRVTPAVAPLTLRELCQAITTYGPVVRFHPDETYKMCSVEWFLQHCNLHDSQAGTEIIHPTAAQLPTGPAASGRYWLVLEDSARGGAFDTAKAYVHAYWKPGMTYTDIQFWLFYAYNGPGTARINRLLFTVTANSADVNLAPLGEHYGDWECCMLRIDNVTKRPIGVWLSQHSSGQYFNQEQLAQFQHVDVPHLLGPTSGPCSDHPIMLNAMPSGPQHVVVYASRNGHALYSGVGANYSEHRVFPIPAVPGADIEFYLRNDTDDGGQQLDCSSRFELISADWLASVVPEPNWVNYPCRWGPEGTETHIQPQTVADLIYAALGWGALLIPGPVLVTLAIAILPAFVTDDQNGPSGPKEKDTWKGQY